MRTINIKKNDAGQRIDKFLSKTLKTLPTSLMYKYIRKKRIKLNGKRCEISSLLKEGDVLSLYINDEFFEYKEDKYNFLKAPAIINVLYEDENIMLVDKPSGLIVHQDDTYKYDTLILRIQHYLYDKLEYNPEDENSFTPALVNRIDRNTGGIVIAAKNAESLRILNDKMKNRELQKKYLCIVHGILKNKQDTITAFLQKNEKQNRVYISKTEKPGYKMIKTKYRVIDEAKGKFSLLEVELLTGRTHQIRAHMAYIGHPLLGDGKYGTNLLNNSTKYRQQALYSYKLKFNFSSPSGILEYLNSQEFEVSNVWFVEDFYNSMI